VRSVKLGTLVSISGGGTPDRSNEAYWGGDIPWVSVKDFKSLEIHGALEHITTEGLDSSATNLIPAGTIIVPTRMALGKAAINTKPVAINQDLKALRVRDESEVDRDYLFRFLLSKASFLESRGKGATVKGITLDVLRDLDVPLPNPQQQRRIAAILKQADNLHRKRRDAIRIADDFLRAAYLEISSTSCERVSIESLLADIPNAVRTGPFGSQLLVSEFTNSGIPVLGIDNVVSNSFKWGARRYVSPEKYEQLARFTVRPGDVIISIMGTTGRVAVAPEDLPLCISTKHLCTLSLNREQMCPEYLWACLRWDPAVKRQSKAEAKGAIMEGWNMGIVKKLLVSKPKLAVQETFVAQLQRVSNFKHVTGQASEETSALLASLEASFFGGCTSEI
jgi:type I restriction enzyme S subunit